MKMRDRSRSRLKGILFEHQCISRQNVIELSKLNGRTVTRCMELLAEQQLVEISRQSIARGQPQIVYTLRQENIFFLLLTVTCNELYTILCDNRGFPQVMHKQQISTGKSIQALLPLLFAAADRMITEPILQGKKIYSAAVDFSFDYALSGSMRNRIVNMLAKFCTHEVFCGYSDEFLLSQYAINNRLSGRILGVIHKEPSGWQQLAVSDCRIDQTLEVKTDKLLQSVTDFSGGKTLKEVLDFKSFLKNFYNKEFAGLKNSFASSYSEVYSRALYGSSNAVKILEDYAAILGKSLVYFYKKLNIDHIVLMHSRPIVIDRVLATAGQEDEKISILTANFSPCEFIYSAAGYLQRDLFGFEHGKLLTNITN